MRKNIAVVVLRFAVALVTILGAARLLLTLSHHGISHLPANVLRALSVAEIAAAVLFVIPRTVRLGGIALLVVYGAAGTVHLLHGDYDVSNLVLLGAAVAVVLAE